MILRESILEFRECKEKVGNDWRADGLIWRAEVLCITSELLRSKRSATASSFGVPFLGGSELVDAWVIGNLDGGAKKSHLSDSLINGPAIATKMEQNRLIVGHRQSAVSRFACWQRKYFSRLSAVCDHPDYGKARLWFEASIWGWRSGSVVVWFPCFKLSLLGCA